MSKVTAEPESPNEGACLRYMSRYHQKRGVLKKSGEPESPNEGACLKYRMSRYHIGGGVFKIYGER